MQRDAAKICTYFHEDYQVQTARGLLSKGLDKQTQRWTATFNTDPAALYRRHSKKISLSESKNSAEELGYWVGRYSENKQLVLVGGKYVAQWKKSVLGVWLIQAEIFTQIKRMQFKLQVIPL